jgi:hypothetical protein
VATAGGGRFAVDAAGAAAVVVDACGAFCAGTRLGAADDAAAGAGEVCVDDFAAG